MSKKERKLKILCLYLNGKNNKIYEAGDEVLEGQIEGRNIDELIRDKAVEVIGESDVTEDVTEDVLPTFVTESGKEVFSAKDCKKDDLIGELEKRGLDFDESETKDALFAKLI